MHMEVILDSSFARPGSVHIGAGKKESSGTGLFNLLFGVWPPSCATPSPSPSSSSSCVCAHKQYR